MPRKENTKAKTWERDRRNRMNSYFKTLAELLPPHQGGRKRNKVDILVHASKYIKDLHNRTEELFWSNASEAHKEELVRLKKLVTQLFSRTQLLSTLLREAGISVPAEPALEKISALKWSNKINLDETDKSPKDVNEKKKVEKKGQKCAEHKVPSKRKSINSSQSSSKKAAESNDVGKDANGSIENQENRVNTANSKSDVPNPIDNVSEVGSKEAECRQTNTSSISGISLGRPLNSKKKSVIQKAGSQRRVKRKAKKVDDKKASVSCINNSVTNLTPNTLILSGGKLMPLVTPVASNIIVNTQQQSGNPIILSNTQQNQMIVMQPLTNRVPSSVVSICNQALINTVQKVALNTVPSIRTKMVVDSQNWASNVKNIIDATKIGGHRGPRILPKGKEITKTTMTYKVPIPAVHKEKVERSKDSAAKRDTEGRPKVSKNHGKNTKNQQVTEVSEDKVEKEENAMQIDDVSSGNGSVKRRLSTGTASADEPADKKRKSEDTIESTVTVQTPSTAGAADFAVTCKSIENVSDAMDEISKGQEENHSFAVENDVAVDQIPDKSNSLIDDVGHKEVTNCSEELDILKSDCVVQGESKLVDDTPVSEISSVSSVKFSDEQLKSSSAIVAVSSSIEFNVSAQSEMGKSTSTVDCSNTKSSLTEIEGTVQETASPKKAKEACSLGTEFDNLLRVTPKESKTVEATANMECNKIILNLDTNTTTTLKPETNMIDVTSEPSASAPTSAPASALASVPASVSAPTLSSPSSSSSLLAVSIAEDVSKITKTTKDDIPKSLPYNTENSFVPISNRADGLHSDLSNDIFASLQVPSSSHNPESISPTAAFLMAFPLVSSLNGKTEVLEEEMKEDFKYHSQTPPMLLQIGTIEPNSFKIKSTSPSHTIAEKPLKVTCEEKKDSNSSPVNPEMIVSVECGSETKALPKVVNDETLREPYKIVHSVPTPTLEKPAGSGSSSSFSHATLYSTAPVPTNTITDNCESQLTTTLENAITNATGENAIAPRICITASSANKTEVTCPVRVQSDGGDGNARYSTSQDFPPSYSTVVDNSLRGMQQNSAIFTNATIQERNSGLTQNVPSNVAQSSLVSHSVNTVTTTNSLSLPLQSIQINYSSHMKDKDTQSSQRDVYMARNKDSLLDTNIATSNRLGSYVGHMDRTQPSSEQGIRQEYGMHTKDGLPILSTHAMQPVYNAQPKNTHVLDVGQNSHQQIYGLHDKSHMVQNTRNDYTSDQNKNLSRKEPMSYPAASGNVIGTSVRNQSFSSKDAIVNSAENHFQRNYPKMSKDSASSTNSIVHQEAKLNDILGSKQQGQQDQQDQQDRQDQQEQQNQQNQQDHRRSTNYATTKKMDVDPFVHSFSYGAKESITTQAEQNALSGNTDNTFQGKRGDSQNYGSYSTKDTKKINNSLANSMVSKPLIQNASIPRYSQQSTSFVATSNYEQSTVTDSHAKSTTTVAHNSSNFSILSWTTFSPVSGGTGNNNLVHFEQPASQNDNTEAKTICENYSYVPLHKENPNFPNVLTNDGYSVNSSVAGLDKARIKSGIESQKQSFVDSSKSRNIQTNAPPSGKHNRMQNQNPSTSTSNDYNKFGTENKNKANKYGMETDYISSEYSSIDQQTQQQHGPKNHHTMPTKQDKTLYPMSTYDPQVNFDLPEVSTQMKYSVEAYVGSNFKYTDKSHQQSQNKYQSLVQGQVPTLQHSSVTYNDEGKHEQQQSVTKSKGNQQQHAVRAPVNWMMTPEIKHNANITDIILPPIGKELEFCQNNLFAQTPSYNQGTPNQFYNNYDVTGHGFPNLPVLQSDPKRSADVFYSEEQPFPWSPTKASVHVEQSQISKGIDQHVAPSSLPTLVGDLDLGTNIPEKQNFLFGQVPSRISSEQGKDPAKDKDGNVGVRDFHTVLNSQGIQHPASGSSFLSVSQLVEHEKAEKSHQQHHQQQQQQQQQHQQQQQQQHQQQQHHQHQHHHHHHPHQHQQQQQQQQQQQARKHQRKTNNASPRGANNKRQMDIRKQNTNNDQLHQRHDEQKSSGHSFTEQAYQHQQKYQQNNIHWRSRNCKSNYTAEALIGTNTSVHDTSHHDKHASIKFASNYPQNKFQSSLPTADTVMPINYFPNTDDGSGYGQMVNQNFNSYAYSSNANIYPTSNFITSISNTPASYMMPLHDNTDYMEANAFLLSNVASSSTATSSTTSTTTTSTANLSVNANTKNHQHYGKHQNCEKRNYPTNVKKGKRKGLDGTMQNLEFPLTGINSPLEDYHHPATFLPPPPPPHASPLYQNHPQTNVYTKGVNGLPPPPPPPQPQPQPQSQSQPPTPVAGPQGVPTVATSGFPVNPNMPRGGIISSNPMTMNHHPSGTSLTNFNLSTIFPEMNDKITGYKPPPNGIPTGLSQSSNQSAAYAQRTNYSTNPLCHLPQISEGNQFGNGVPPPPPPPPPGVIHYKNV